MSSCRICLKYHKTVLLHKLTVKCTVYKITVKAIYHYCWGSKVNIEIVRAQVTNLQMLFLLM